MRSVFKYKAQIGGNGAKRRESRRITVLKISVDKRKEL